SGLLAADTCTLTLFTDTSGHHAFRDTTSGHFALDGLNNGTAGSGNYVNSSLTVAAATTPIVPVPYFARGARQTAHVPNNGSRGIPISVASGSGSAISVTQVSFTLNYDPTLLTIAPTGALTLSSAASAAGLVLQSYSITTVNAHLAQLTASVSGGSGWSVN